MDNNKPGTIGDRPPNKKTPPQEDSHHQFPDEARDRDDGTVADYQTTGHTTEKTIFFGALSDDDSLSFSRHVVLVVVVVVLAGLGRHDDFDVLEVESAALAQPALVGVRDGRGE
mmetsp:Transcript_27199/g.108909  ORF Transcript_27199/g.108909 Transcript_27199/m.108909 type:complete len:114 (-) Transcript_27199:1023-1364(-)